jgi:hypothetical protein
VAKLIGRAESSAPGPTHTSGIQVSRCLGHWIRKKPADIVDMATLGWFI